MIEWYVSESLVSGPFSCNVVICTVSGVRSTSNFSPNLKKRRIPNWIGVYDRTVNWKPAFPDMKQL